MPDSPTRTDLLEQTSEWTADDGANRLAMVGGDQPRLASEIRVLLRRRLRAVSAVMSLGFGAFLLRQRVFEEFTTGGLAWLFELQRAAMLGLLGLTAIVFTQRDLSLRALRWIEFGVFALPGAYLAVLQHTTAMRGAASAEPEAPRFMLFNLTICIVFWQSLIFVYGTFIPTTWRRSLAVMGMLTAAPLGLMWFDHWRSPRVAEVVDVSVAVMLSMILLIAGAVSLYGSMTIGSLRREAFEARQLGQYRLKRLLGRGGMGEVYLAEHLLLKRPCAIKLIRAGRDTDPAALRQFEREVRATAELSHWHTVDVYDYGHTEDGTFYYVMEYLPGMSLAQLVDRYGPLPPARAVHLLRQACQALEEAHNVGLIHRDIKPGNIFAAKRGGLFDVVKLLDFGLVRQTGEPSAAASHDGAVVGSPLYMAPEQALGRGRPDARSDIYALGCVGYFLLTGKPPFTGERPMEVLAAHARDAVVAPSARGAQLPCELEAILLRCLAKNPAERYATAAALDAALAACPLTDTWTAGQAANWWRDSGAAANLG